jgi:glycosyltransferase involved in cell wall biosynthesis
MKISIVICTRNRADSLARALDSICRAAQTWTMPWELVIVDNGSTDHTADVASSLAREASYQIRLVHEPRVGVSQAKNRGIREATGEWLAFTDDDCLVTPGWLPAIHRGFQLDSAVGLIAGRTELWDPTLFPHCVRTSAIEAEYRWPTGPEFMAGNNIALPARVFSIVGGFDERLGPGTRAYSAEDGDLVYRVLKAGFVGKYLPDALLYHDHRRSVDDLRVIRRNYAVGNGAFLMKHILRGDLYALKMAYWGLRWLIVDGSRSETMPLPDRKTIMRALLVGAGIRFLHL